MATTPRVAEPEQAPADTSTDLPEQDVVVEEPAAPASVLTGSSHLRQVGGYSVEVA